MGQWQYSASEHPCPTTSMPHNINLLSVTEISYFHCLYTVFNLNDVIVSQWYRYCISKNGTYFSRLCLFSVFFLSHKSCVDLVSHHPMSGKLMLQSHIICLIGEELRSYFQCILSSYKAFRLREKVKYCFLNSIFGCTYICNNFPPSQHVILHCQSLLY